MAATEPCTTATALVDRVDRMRDNINVLIRELAKTKAEPCTTATALVGRVDRMRAEIDVLMRELAQTKAAVKAALAAGPEASAEDEAKGQPEWIGCRDAEEAKEILLAVDEWLDRFGRVLGFDVEQCWPWHPDVVALLLASARHHTEVYKGKAPDKVSDFLARVRPIITKQVRQIFAGARCNEHEHLEPSGGRYQVHLELVPDLAAWWATDREGLQPGLSSRLGATG